MDGIDLDNQNEAVDAIMAKLDDEPEDTGDGAGGQEGDGTQAGEPAGAAPVDPASGTKEGTNELGETSAIEPPALWNGELKARWNDIPADLQRGIAQQERERNSGVGTKLEEAAAARQAADQERQRFAQLADFVANSFAADPILADAQKTDWDKLASDNPSEWAAKRQAVETRVAQLQAIEEERQRVAADNLKAATDRGHKELERLLPEWKDEGKRTELKGKLKEAATHYGFSAQELANLTDPRSVVVLRDAMEYRRMQAAQRTVGDKRTTPQPGRTLRPGNGETRQPAARVQALKATALRTGKETDAVNAVLAAIGD